MIETISVHCERIMPARATAGKMPRKHRLPLTNPRGSRGKSWHAILSTKNLFPLFLELRLMQKNICEKTGKVLFRCGLLIAQVGNTRICGIIMGSIQRLVILAGNSVVFAKSANGNTRGLLEKIANQIWMKWIMSQIRHEAE